MWVTDYHIPKPYISLSVRDASSNTDEQNVLYGRKFGPHMAGNGSGRICSCLASGQTGNDDTMFADTADSVEDRLANLLSEVMMLFVEHLYRCIVFTGEGTNPPDCVVFEAKVLTVHFG